MASDDLILNDGHTLPRFGVGTYRIRDAETLRKVISTATTNGCRLIDTANVYRNEKIIGTLLQELDTDLRNHLVLTTKLAPKDQGYDACREAVIQSAAALQVPFIHLLLIHWPGTAKMNVHDPRNRSNRLESYRALIALQKEGLVRSIGVSNFTLPHLLDLASVFPDHPPAVLQIELHPLYHDPALLSYCQENRITIQAYSSLGEGALIKDDGPLPGLSQRASKAHISPAQMLLAWALHHGWAIIPKSVHPEKIVENIQCLQIHLDDEDMTWLDEAQAREGRQKFCWDPSSVA